MTITTAIDVWEAALLALTPLERWSAVRRVDPRPPHEYSPLLAVTLLLFALVVLLWLVSHRRKARRAGASRELFWDDAVQGRFGARDRELLAAIAARSGLRRREDILTAADAFDRGTAKLLGEYAGRTPEETARLRADVVRLREKLVPSRGGRAEARAATGEDAHAIATSAPGAVARLPSASAGSADGSPDGTQTGWIEFVPATATEVEGSSLRIDTLLPVQIGERVLVVLRLPSAFLGETTHGAERRERLMGHVGRVTDVKATDNATSITVELTGPADVEIGAAAQLAGTAGNTEKGFVSRVVHGPVTQGV